MTYDACARFLEDLSSNEPNEYHLVLHLDNATDDKNIFRLERFARRTGYEMADAEGKYASDVLEPQHWEEQPERAQTSAHSEDVFERWVSDCPVSLNISCIS